MAMNVRLHVDTVETMPCVTMSPVSVQMDVRVTGRKIGVTFAVTTSMGETVIFLVGTVKITIRVAVKPVTVQIRVRISGKD